MTRHALSKLQESQVISRLKTIMNARVDTAGNFGRPE
jgi:hypothetical protein